MKEQTLPRFDCNFCECVAIAKSYNCLIASQKNSGLIIGVDSDNNVFIQTKKLPYWVDYCPECGKKIEIK